MDDNQRQNWWPDMNGSSGPQEPGSQPPFPPASDSPSGDAGGPDSGSGSSGSGSPYNNGTDGGSYGPYGGPEGGPAPGGDPGYGAPPPYQSSGFQGNYNYGGQNYRPPVSGPSGFSTASLVMGIISLLLICCGISYVFGAMGIIFAILSRKGRHLDSQAALGLGLSITGSVIGIIVLIAFLAGNGAYLAQTFQQYENYLDGDGYYPYGHDDYDDYFDHGYGNSYYGGSDLNDYLDDPQWEDYGSLPFGQEAL